MKMNPANGRHHPLIYVSLLLMLALSLWQLGQRGLWTDEAHSVLDALDAQNMLQNISQTGGTRWFYFTLLSWWVRIGDSEFIVRSFSAFFAVLTVAAFYALARLLVNGRVAILASLIMALNPFLLTYAQEARNYTLLTFLAVVSSLLFVKLIRRPSRQYSLLYTLSGALLVYTHPFGALVVATHGFSSLFLLPKRLPWRPLLTSFLGMGALVLPAIFLFGLPNNNLISWLPAPTATELLILYLVFAGGQRGLLILYATAVIIGAGLGIPALMRRREYTAVWGHLFLLSWMLIPALAAYIFSITIKPIFLYRYLIICLPPFILLVASGISSLRLRLHSRLLYVLFIVGILYISSSRVANWYNRGDGQDWRTAAAWVASEANDNDAALFYYFIGRVPFEYYWQRQAHPDVQMIELASDLYGASGGGQQPLPNYDLLKQLPTRHERIWLVLAHAQDGQRDAVRLQVQALLAQEYAMQFEYPFKGVKVILYTHSEPVSP